MFQKGDRGLLSRRAFLAGKAQGTGLQHIDLTSRIKDPLNIQREPVMVFQFESVMDQELQLSVAQAGAIHQVIRHHFFLKTGLGPGSKQVGFRAELFDFDVPSYFFDLIKIRRLGTVDGREAQNPRGR